MQYPYGRFGSLYLFILRLCLAYFDESMWQYTWNGSKLDQLRSI